jgi:hypothetical protein
MQHHGDGAGEPDAWYYVLGTSPKSWENSEVPAFICCVILSQETSIYFRKLTPFHSYWELTEATYTKLLGYYLPHSKNTNVGLSQFFNSTPH